MNRLIPFDDVFASSREAIDQGDTKVRHSRIRRPDPQVLLDVPSEDCVFREAVRLEGRRVPNFPIVFCFRHDASPRVYSAAIACLLSRVFNASTLRARSAAAGGGAALISGYSS